MSVLETFLEMESKSRNIDEELVEMLICLNNEYLNEPIKGVKIIILEAGCPIYQIDDAPVLVKREADGRYVRSSRTVEEIEKEKNEFEDSMLKKFAETFLR